MNELFGRSVEVNGATLHDKEHGDGAPLILIHDGPTLERASVFASLIQDFARRHAST